MLRSLSRNIDKFDKRQDNSFLRYVNVEDFLEHLEIANVTQHKPDVFRFSCPFSGHTHGDENPSAVFNDGNHEYPTRWQCFGCHRRGNAISFLAQHQNISRTIARKWLKDHYARGYLKPKGGISAEFEQRLKNQVGSVNQELEVIQWEEYERFEVDWQWFYDNKLSEPEVSYLFKRGFTVSDLGSWGIGYDSISDRFTIPVCDPRGNLIGVKGRSWREGHNPKYCILGDKEGKKARYGFKPYEKSKVLFGIHRWGEQKTYVLDEGELNVISFGIMEIPAFCSGGSSLSETQENIIRSFCEEVILFYNYDKAGESGAWGTEDRPGVVHQLKDHLRVKVAPQHHLDANSLLQRGKTKVLRRLVEAAEPWYIVERRRQREH